MALNKPQSPKKQSLWERLLSLPNLSGPDAARAEKGAKRHVFPPSVECLWNDLSNSLTHQQQQYSSAYCHLPDNSPNYTQSVTSIAHASPSITTPPNDKMNAFLPDSACSNFAYDNRAMVQDYEPVYANLDLRPAQNLFELPGHVDGNETPIYAVPNQPIYANLSTGILRTPSSIPDCVAPDYLDLPASSTPTGSCQAHCTCGGALSTASTHPHVHKSSEAQRSRSAWPNFIDASKKVSFTRPCPVSSVVSGKQFQTATEEIFCENCTCFLDPVELTEKYANFDISGNPELYCVGTSTPKCPNPLSKNKLNLRIDTKAANSERRTACLTDPMYDFIMNSPVVKKLREYGFTYPGEDELRRRRQLHCAIFCLVVIVIVLIVMNVVVPQIVKIKPLKHRMGFPIGNKTKPSELIQKNRPLNPGYDGQKFFFPTTSRRLRPPSNPRVQLITGPPLRVRTGVTVQNRLPTTPLDESDEKRPPMTTEGPNSIFFERTTKNPVVEPTISSMGKQTVSRTFETTTLGSTTESVDIIFHYSPSTRGSKGITTEEVTTATIPYSTWFPPYNPNAICTANQFKCTAGVSSVPCLDPWKKCDGIQDCSDGSDEEYCDKLNCYGNFQCDSGACVSLEKVCNGIPDCVDKKDELICDTFKCRYDDYEHRCNSGYCIPKEFVCDKEADCPDHGDEYGCSKSCGSDEFLCPEGWCIPDSWVCNGISDCAGAEDEIDCQCTPSQFSCVGGGCADKELVCDGVPNCVDGSDEWNCVTNEPILKMRDAINEEWLPVCADQWTSEHSARVCRQLGHRTAVEHRKVPLSVSSLTSEVFRLSDLLPPLHGNNTKLQFLVKKRPLSACKSNKMMKVFCETHDCGIWHPSDELLSKNQVRGRVKRVVGGHVSGKHQWPSMVVMVHTQHVQACSASIIAPYWVITSARCVRNTNAISWKIVAGNGQPDESDPEMLTRSVQEFVRHPSYKFGSALSDFDVVLVRLKEPLDLTTGEPSPLGTKSRVGAICLPREQTDKDTWCVTAGWGSTTPGGYYVNKQLRHLEMKVWTAQSCNGSDHYRGMLSSRMLCAKNEHSEPCFYDEGGPLMCHDPAYGRWYLAGVMTAHSCDSLGHPAVFADVFQLKQWIKNTITN